MKPLLAITDRRLMGPDPLATIARLMERRGPEVIVQLREKDLEVRVLWEWVRALLPVRRATGAGLSINGRADLARCFAPEVGVHLPEDGLPPAEAVALMPEGTRISASRHDTGAAVRAIEEGASLVTLSPIFPTPSKPGSPPLGLAALEDTVRRIGARGVVYALGGIDAENEGAVRAAGAGVAAIRSAWISR